MTRKRNREFGGKLVSFSGLRWHPVSGTLSPGTQVGTRLLQGNAGGFGESDGVSEACHDI